LLRLWEQAACQRLRDAFDKAFGGVPGDVAIRPMVVRAPPGPALVELGTGGPRPADGRYHRGTPRSLRPAA
jgi:hypothetical protein